METPDNPATEVALSALRAGIKNKYRDYHLIDRDRFPDFEYNTNRANYEPLRVSFAEEFYVVRGIDRTKNNLHIPSTNTLALLFCDESYMPSKKILDTCRLYAAGEVKGIIGEPVPAISYPEVAVPLGRSNNKIKSGLIVLASFVLFAGLVIYGLMAQQVFLTPFSKLTIDYPGNDQIVTRQLFAEGKATNASTVWLVVHPSASIDYYVQPPIKVKANGSWKGILYIGNVNTTKIGMKFQLRACVNPVNVLAEGDLLHSWPKAELSSATLDVIRGRTNE